MQEQLIPCAPTESGTYFAVVKLYTTEDPQRCVLHYQKHKGTYRAVGHAFSVEVQAGDVMGYVGEGAQQGALWVKSDERLPSFPVAQYGIQETDKNTSFKVDGYPALGVMRKYSYRDQKDPFFVVFDEDNDASILGVADFYRIEWLDESGQSTEGVKDREVDIDELWDEHSEHIDDDIDSLSRWAGSTVVDKEQFRTLVAKLWERLNQQSKYKQG
jgi:hypothetical protein